MLKTMTRVYTAAGKFTVTCWDATTSDASRGFIIIANQAQGRGIFLAF